jgi:hypothetical protein
MLRRMVVTAVMLAGMTGATGCSWLFQDRLRGGFNNYTGQSEPRCSTSKGWPVVDGLFGGLHVLSTVLVATSEEPVENRDAILLGNVLWAVVHTASAITGASWASDCQRAYDEWDAIEPEGAQRRAQEQARLALLELAGKSQNNPQQARAFWCAASTGDCVVDRAACAENECSRQETAWCASDKGGFVCSKTRGGCLAARFTRRRSRTLGECVEHRAGLAHLPEEPSRAAPSAVGPNPSTPPPLVPAPPAPRGYYCSSSTAKPVAGFCTREKADCQRVRDAARAAVTDLAECRLVEAAFCHVADGSEQCAPTMETCVERAKSATGVTAACEERK